MKLLKVVNSQEQTKHHLSPGAGTGRQACLRGMCGKPREGSSLSQGILFSGNLLVTQSAAKQIFLVDDDPVARMILADMLSNAGCIVTSAESGAQAESTIKAHYTNGEVFDACFFDVSLGDTTGVALVKKLRGQLSNFITPVIFISANAKIEIDTLHGKAENTLYLEKPFTSENIRDILAVLFRSSAA